MTLKEITIGTAVERPIFKAFSVQQDSSGNYSATVVYGLGTYIGDRLVAESGLMQAVLSDSEVRNHPQFAALYPLIQTFARSTLAAQRPDLVES